MRRKPYSTWRYVHIMWDGIYDTYRDPDCERELTLTEIAKIMNDVDNQIRVWQNKYDEVKRELENTRKQLDACRKRNQGQ